MNEDFRISVDFFSHHKTRKLKKRLGDEGIICLLKVWAYASKARSNGSFEGMTDEDIELSADWSGEDGVLVSTLIEVGFIDDNGEDGRCLHDWLENNPWVFGAGSRSDSSRLSRMAMTMPKEYEALVEGGVKGLGKKEYEELKISNDRQTIVKRIVSDRQQFVNDSESPAPSPSPSPYIPPPPTRVCAREGSALDPGPMTTDWQPSEFFQTLADTSGLPPQTHEQLQEHRREFVTFWLTQNRKRTPHEWDLAFIKAIKHGFSTPRESGKKRASPAGPWMNARQQYMQDLGNLLEAMDGAETGRCAAGAIEAGEPLPGVGTQRADIIPIGR